MPTVRIVVAVRMARSAEALRVYRRAWKIMAVMGLLLLEGYSRNGMSCGCGIIGH
jgi:hypothetical protein